MHLSLQWQVFVLVEDACGVSSPHPQTPRPHHLQVLCEHFHVTDAETEADSPQSHNDITKDSNDPDTNEIRVAVEVPFEDSVPQPDAAEPDEEMPVRVPSDHSTKTTNTSDGKKLKAKRKAKKPKTVTSMHRSERVGERLDCSAQAILIKWNKDTYIEH